MKFEFNFEIVEIYEKEKYFDVVYSREGKPSVRASVRFPFWCENVTDAIAESVPILLWEKGVSELHWSAPMKMMGTLLYDDEEQSHDKNIPRAYPEFESDRKAVNDFFLSKNLKSDVGTPVYLYSVFNVTTNEIMSHAFDNSSGPHFVKVKSGEILEWYEYYYGFDSTQRKYDAISRNLITGDILDKYVFDENGVKKLPRKDGEQPTITYSCLYRNLPFWIKKLLENFVYKEYIRCYSFKSYGLIVEFEYPNVYHAKEESFDLKRLNGMNYPRYPKK